MDKQGQAQEAEAALLLHRPNPDTMRTLNWLSREASCFHAKSPCAEQPARGRSTGSGGLPLANPDGDSWCWLYLAWAACPALAMLLNNSQEVAPSQRPKQRLRWLPDSISTGDAPVNHTLASAALAFGPCDLARRAALPPDMPAATQAREVIAAK